MALEQPQFPLFGGNAKTSSRNSNVFPDPFLDYASTQMPRDIDDVFRWCQYIWLNNATYRMAMQRVVRYFLTRVELTDASDDEKEKYEEFLKNDLRIMQTLALTGDNLMCYGNDLLSIYVPFNRLLRCPKCRLEQPIHRATYKWDFTSGEFRGSCPNPDCKHSGAFTRVDRRDIKSKKLRVIHWPITQFKIWEHPVSGRKLYLWKIPTSFKRYIEQGNTFYLEDTPWEIIESIRNKDEFFRFDDDVIYHTRTEVVSGVEANGWGIPLIMSNFKQAWYIQVLKRYNEAIAMDYIVPFRVITPVAGGTSKEADPLLSANLGSFQAKVFQMWREHRKDPTTLHALPFQVQLQMLGVEGQQLAPVDLLTQANDEFLNGQGVPAQLYRGDLQWQAMPAALRLFERTWVSLVTELDGLLNWIFKRISDLQNWENLRGRLQPVTYADDLDKKQMQLQLASGNQISKQTAYAPFGINYREEIRRQLEEQQYQMEQQQRFQEEMEQKQQLQSTVAQGAAGAAPPGAPGGPPAGAAPPGGAPPQGGAPAPGGAPAQGAVDPATGMVAPPSPSAQVSPAGPGSQMTPEDMMQQAEQIATQLLGMPQELRRGELGKIKKSNETLHSLIMGKMDSIRSQAKSVGGYQALQQMVGGQGAQ